MPNARRPTPADLTIAVCTVGRNGFLQAALNSLLHTTPADVTLSMVFNGCTDTDLIDEVTNLIADWDGPTSVKILDERLGIAGSHNVALNAATTDFITFMGDDDLVLEPRVQRLLDVFADTTPTPVVVGSFCRRVSGDAHQAKFTTNKDYGPATIEEWDELRMAPR